MKDRESGTIKVGGYTVSDDYKGYLDNIVNYHEKNNVLAAVKSIKQLRMM